MLPTDSPIAWSRVTAIEVIIFDQNRSHWFPLWRNAWSYNHKKEKSGSGH